MYIIFEMKSQISSVLQTVKSELFLQNWFSLFFTSSHYKSKKNGHRSFFSIVFVNPMLHVLTCILTRFVLAEPVTHEPEKYTEYWVTFVHSKQK